MSEIQRRSQVQLLRAEHGLKKYPATWPPKDATGGFSVQTERKEPLVNGLGDCESIKVNGHKRKRNGDCAGDDIRMNGTNGVKKSAHIAQQTTDSLVLTDVVSLALDWNLPDLSDNVSWTSSPR